MVVESHLQTYIRGDASHCNCEVSPLQIVRVEPFGEPAVHRSEQFARLLHLAAPADARRGAKDRNEHREDTGVPTRRGNVVTPLTPHQP